MISAIKGGCGEGFFGEVGPGIDLPHLPSPSQEEIDHWHQAEMVGRRARLGGEVDKRRLTVGGLTRSIQTL